jgi:hypothetical protein
MRTHMLFRRFVIVVVLLAFGAVACGDNDDTQPTNQSQEPAFPPPVSPYEPQIDPADFVASIDNPYLPLEPGTTLVYEGQSDGEKETDTIVVTDKTKEILGITCTVVKDVVTVDGVIAEKTLDWFAQDRYGNVWYFGEISKEYEDGKFAGLEGSWEAGVDGAQPGIVMLGDPEVGDEYRQEYYAGEAEDFGKVVQLDASVEVPYGSFDNVLITEDWNPLEPKVLENKYYAKGIGVVFEEAVKGANEELKLIEVTRG